MQRKKQYIGKKHPSAWIKIRGKKGRAVVDTGAQINVITLAAAKKLGIREEEIKPTMIRVKGIQGKHATIKGLVKDIPIQIGEMLFRIDAVVMAESLDADLIIGFDWIA